MENKMENKMEKDSKVLTYNITGVEILTPHYLSNKKPYDNSLLLQVLTRKLAKDGSFEIEIMDK